MMTRDEEAGLRRRLRNQRRALKQLNAYVAQQALWLRLANDRSEKVERLYSAAVNKRYRTRAYRLYVWWRNRVLWRCGQLMPGWRAQWNARMWYDRGVADATRALGVPGARKFPEGQ